jgi:tetratricopeptide (TPR) repeat protein
LNIYFVFVISLFIYLTKTLQATSSIEPHKLELRLCFAFIIGYFVISFFDFPKERIEHSVLINIIFAIVYFRVKSSGPIVSYGNLKITKTMFNTSTILVAFIFVIGLLRYRGEYYTKNLYDYKNSNQPDLLVQSGISAKSFAYTLDPTSMPIYWYVGNAEIATPENRQYLLEDFKKAYQQNPYNRNVLNDLASAYALDNRIELAKQYYEEAARISPRFDEPKLNLVALYINEKNYEIADAWNRSVLHNSERRSQYQRIIDAFR